MTELQPLDTGFIELEDADRRISLGIAVVAIMAGAPPPREELTETFRARLAAVPRLRQRVRRAPLDMTAPVWEPDPAFDLAHHLRWAGLPGPRDEDTLSEVVAGEIEARFDRDRPLWRCVVVEGLTEQRWALVMSAHHSLVDGVSGVSVFEKLCDPEPGGAPAAPSAATRRGRRPPPLTDILKLPVSLPATVLGTLRGLVPVATAVLGQGTVSSLNGPIGRQRRFTAVRISLSTVAEIGAAYEVTVNDVVLAAITAGYRELLRNRGEDPALGGLRIVVPVSMRAEHAGYLPGNRVSAVLPHLPIDRTDAIERLRVVHARMAAQKSGGAPKAEDTVLSLAHRLPFAPLAWGLRLAARFPQRAVGALATNVPGPKRELALGGRKVLELWPAAPIAMRLRTAVAVLSYHDHLVFGITGDFDSTPDIGALAVGIRREVAELADRAR